MRLVCPNCGAQYEVDDTLIPAEGRDVQCSDCGHGWFQEGANAEAALEEALEGATLPDATAEPEPEPEPEPEVVAEHEPELLDDDDDEALDDTSDEDEDDPEREAALHARRTHDERVLEVLRAEAEHEARARASDTGDFEAQDDLGLDADTDEAERRAAQARERMARLRGIEPDETSESRSGLLPDIDEINSTLRAETERKSKNAKTREVVVAETATRRRGFRFGFVAALAIAAVLTVLYAWAPSLANRVPAAAPFLASYSNVVNDVRVQLELGMQSSIASISAFLEKDGDAGDGSL